MNICNYGCNKEATHQLKNKKWCCEDSPNKCIVIKEKNAKNKEGNPNFYKERNPNFTKKQCKYCKDIKSSPGLKRHENYCYLNPKNIKHCKKCNKILKNYRNTFCNPKCANSHEDNIRRGENHPNWTGGEDTEYRVICFKYYEKKCIICGFDCTVDVHHIDENSKNNSPENLVPICPNHHRMSTMNKYKEFIKEEINKNRACSLIGKAPALHAED